MANQRSNPAALQDCSSNTVYEVSQCDIAASWRNSQEAGVSANFNENCEDASAHSKRKAPAMLAPLVNLARNTLASCISVLDDSPYVALVSDVSGGILARLSTAAADSLSSFPALGCLSEQSIGATAANFAVQRRTPVLLDGSQHYLSELKNWADCAAPVTDEAGAVLLVVSLFHLSTGLAAPQASDFNRIMLANVIATTTSICDKHNLVTVRSLSKQTSEMFTSSLTLTDHPLLVVTHQGYLAKANPMALQALHLPKDAKLPLPFQPFFDKEEILFEHILSGVALNAVRAQICIGDKTETFNISTRPLLGDSSATPTYILMKLKTPNDGPAQPSTPASALVAHDTFENFVGVSPNIKRTIELARTVAPTNASILIEGDFGTGKLKLAHAIHNSRTPNRPFVNVNCASLYPRHARIEIFGLGGTKEGFPGHVEKADGGTLFLDKIDELPEDTQMLLARVLDSKTFCRCESSEERVVNFRLICTTSIDLADLVSQGKFRKELYYQISIVHLVLPPIRERKDDILPLTNQIITDYCASRHVLPITLTPAARNAIRQYDWPGNVRQMQGAIKIACDFCRNRQITIEELPSELMAKTDGDEASPTATAVGTIDEMKRRQIISALLETDYNISDAAKLLGIGRSTLYKQIKRYNISR